jgi:hypothetical protein
MNQNDVPTQKNEDKIDYVKELNNFLKDNCGHYDGNGRYIYSVFHTILIFIAIYLTFKCNKEFNILPFLAALIFPQFYIIYILATRGTCGVLE